MRNAARTTIQLGKCVGYTVLTILLYSIYYYIRNFSWAGAISTLTIVVIAWPCCVVSGYILCVARGLWKNDSIIRFGLLLSLLMVFYIFILGNRSFYDVLSDSIYSCLWFALLCIFFSFALKYGIPKGLITESYIFIPFITSVFIELVLSHQTSTTVRTLNPIFYIVYLTPFVLLVKKPIFRYFGLAIILGSVILSNKRTALFTLTLIILIEVFSYSIKKNRTGILRKIAITAMFIVGIVLIYNFALENFKIDWIARINEVSETGGGGRTRRWLAFFNDMNSSSVLEFIFGHGIVYPYYHNDWMQIYYDTGIIGFAFYAVMCSSLVFRYFDMKKHCYQYAAAYGASLVIFFLDSFVGQVSLYTHGFLK